MDYLTMRANAKINIALDVTGKREDGYHDLATIMQSVGLNDVLFLKKIFSPQIKLITNLRWLPTDERNLVYRAAAALFERFPQRQGVFIELTKHIPACAGLGGGSADCAAALVGIRNLFDMPMDNDGLEEIGRTLGADVPFCIRRGTALAEGIGEKLTPLKAHPQVYVLLAKPGINISTAAVFQSLNLEEIRERPDIPAMIRNIEEGNLPAIAGGFCNVLEGVTAKNHAVIGQIKAVMVAQGALGALMSGSGPTVFGYFIRKSDAFTALRQLRYGLGVKETFLTTIFNPWRE